MVRENRVANFLAAALVTLLLAACATSGGESKPEESLPVATEVTPLEDTAENCAGTFVAHTLDHTTTVPGGDQVRNFEANGSGVAINDLDNDGDLDIVLGNHAGSNTILWNEGGLDYRVERMEVGDTRLVTIVDLDGDGWLDILLTRTGSAPNYWHNDAAVQPGRRTFTQHPLPAVGKPLYTANWGDLDGDGDLDMVGATYDAGLLDDFGVDFLMSGNAGVYYYENEGGEFSETRLSSGAQALTIILLDLNQDGQLDVMVGNDFAVFDQAWVRANGEWEEWPSLETTTHSTMSFDLGDVDNDGAFELFASDMKPYVNDAETAAAWQPVLRALLSDAHPEGDPQLSENMFQVRGRDGVWHNEAIARGLEATGWSWSSKFGDLDQDGFLDLY
ncbi:MAG: VCBS repeat-containing protein, partial [Anaerolineae bacterium]